MSAAPPNPMNHLGDLEMATLEHLWACGEDDVAGTHRQLGEPRGITANTVGSALERLAKKGLLLRRKVSHAYRYAPALTRDAFMAQRVLAASHGLGALARAGLLSAFVDLVADVDAAALDRLQLLIDRKRAAGRAGDPRR